MYGRQFRSAFTKLRISAHSLMIEKGRHLNPKLPIDQRICTMCPLNEIEDESHFMLKCTYYSIPRLKMLSDISEAYNIKNISDNKIFILLMSSQDYDTITSVLKFVNSSFKLRAKRDA